jgi:hypothetical protein
MLVVLMRNTTYSETGSKDAKTVNGGRLRSLKKESGFGIDPSEWIQKSQADSQGELSQEI